MQQQLHQAIHIDIPVDNKHLVVILRAPENEGRPLKYISDSIVKSLRAHLDLDIYDPRYNAPETKAPENGGDFYNADAAALLLKHHLDSILYGILNAKKNGRSLTFVIMDAELPIVPIIAYYAILWNIEIKTLGVWHSSSTTHGDMFYGSKHMRAQDEALLKILDVSVVATLYLENNLRQIVRFANIHTLGLPLPNPISYDKDSEREDVMAWPHRVAENKGLSILLAVGPSARKSGFPIRVLTPVPLSVDQLSTLSAHSIDVVFCSTKQEYFHNLTKCKVILSTAILETFGYSVADGVMHGCIPLLPLHPCYIELYSGVFHHNTPDSIIQALDVVRAGVGNLSLQMKWLSGSADRISQSIHDLATCGVG